MRSLAQISSYVIVAAMFLAGGAPLLPDTTPGSERSIIQAVSGVLLALGMLLNLLQLRQVRQAQAIHDYAMHDVETPVVHSEITAPDLRDLVITLLFTIVELVTLAVWGVLIGAPAAFSIFAAVVLFSGLFLEHFISRFKG